MQWARANGHSLLTWARPSYRATWRELKARGDLPGTEQPRLVVDLRDARAGADKGRYLFHLVHEFHLQGYLPTYVARFPLLAPVRAKRHRALLLELPFAVVDRAEDVEGPFVHLTDHDGPASLGVKKQVRLSYAFRRARAGEHALSFGMHPPVALIGVSDETSIDVDRPVRILFAGNTNPASYDHAVLRRRHGVMTRREVVERVKERLVGGHVVLERPAVRLPAATFLTAEALVPPIPDAQWLSTLAQADFFLAAPGTHMPLCHNLVEAMLVGTIPILEYGSYLEPALEDGVNCLAFRGSPSLDRAVERAVAIGPDELLALRVRVREYAARWLAPGLFARRLLEEPGVSTVLLRGLHAPRER